MIQALRMIIPVLHKILHNVDHSLHCKPPQFLKLIRMTWHTAQKKDKTFVLARYNTYQFFWCFTCSTICLWNNLQNEAVLAVKHSFFLL